MKNTFVFGISMLLYASNMLAQINSLVPVTISYIPNANLGVRDVHTDCAGNVIYVGGTKDTGFQCTPGTINSTYLGGNSDVFIIKVDTGGQVLWSTLLGGYQYDRAYAVEVDSAGFIYVAGRAGNGLQTTECALQPTFQGDNDLATAYGVQDGFITKITPDGSAIVWSTYIGCNGRGFIRDIDLDSKGNVWAGISSTSSNFPLITSNAVQTSATHSQNTALVKVSADGKTLLFGTYMADGVTDGGPTTVRVDKNDNVFLLSHATVSNIPVTPGVFQPSPAGNLDFVISKFDAIGNLIFCSFLGGSDREDVETHSLEIDASGNPIIAAYSRSVDYPVLANAVQKTYLGNYEGVITKISADGSTMLASTYLGGSGSDGIEGIGIDAQNRIYVSGSTDSPAFPATTGTAYQPTIGGGTDGHLTVLSEDLSTILYSTFIGGSATDLLRTCHVDEWGRLHAGGASGSANYPIHNAFHPTLTGSNTGVAVTFQPDDFLLPGALCVLNNDFADPCLSTAAIELNGLEINVFPNPATESITIESGFSENLIRVEISGSNGQLQLSKAMAGTSQKLDVSCFPRGFYCLKIVSESGIVTKKIHLQ